MALKIPEPTSHYKSPAVEAARRGHRLITALLGIFLGLAVLKFGNPTIMEKWVTVPADLYEFVLGNPWPIAWAYGLLGVLAILALFTVVAKPSAPLWLLGLPLLWLVWQLIAGGGTIQTDLSRAVIFHFIACVGCFYLGVFCSNSDQPLKRLIPPLVISVLLVLIIGWQQHFGGLEQTRKYFFLYLYPKMKEVSPEYIKKLSSSRIFATLFYPNALAGAILLLLPVSLQFVWQARERFTAGARAFLVFAIAAAALACLYWSGSKGGWLLMLLLVVFWLLRLPLDPKYKKAFVLGLVLLGLLGFFWKYSGFFKKGATSVTARFDYWSASIQNTKSHPVLGTGPGTFALVYAKLKRPESEMARLVHNDYLQQASDSGLPGCLLYSILIISMLVTTFPLGTPEFGRQDRLLAAAREPMAGAVIAAVNSEQMLWFAVWLGTLGWALQSLMEFGLYIPALAWPAFTFMGCLLTHRFRVPTQDGRAVGRMKQ